MGFKQSNFQASWKNGLSLKWISPFQGAHFDDFDPLHLGSSLK